MLRSCIQNLLKQISEALKENSIKQKQKYGPHQSYIFVDYMSV